MTKRIRSFVDWWEKQPGYIALPLLPVLLILYLIAIVKNIFFSKGQSL